MMTGPVPLATSSATISCCGCIAAIAATSATWTRRLCRCRSYSRARCGQAHEVLTVRLEGGHHHAGAISWWRYRHASTADVAARRIRAIAVKATEPLGRLYSPKSDSVRGERGSRVPAAAVDFPRPFLTHYCRANFPWPQARGLTHKMPALTAGDVDLGIDFA